MNLLLRITILLLIAVGLSCMKDRTFPLPPGNIIGPGGKDDIQVGTLRVNEIVATGSTLDNSLTPASDWIELFNTTQDTIVLKEGQWYMSDSLNRPEKQKLPELTIMPRGYLIVWADSKDTLVYEGGVLKEVHVKFGLNKDMEDVVLFYKKNSTEKFVVDYISYGPQQNGKSYGRMPDGTSNIDFLTPTPLEANKL